MRSRALGIDYGQARIGLALSDESKIIASPYQTLSTEKDSKKNAELLLNAVANIEKEKQCTVSTLVFGIPLHMDGHKGAMADEIEELIGQVEKKYSGQIIRWDERLTSIQADRMLREAKLTRKKRAKVIDPVAAAIILQNYLDSR